MREEINTQIGQMNGKVSGAVFKKGEAIYRTKGGVVEVEGEGRGVYRVAGSDGGGGSGVFGWEVDLRAGEGQMCGCKAGRRGNMCKHVVAAALKWTEREMGRAGTR